MTDNVMIPENATPTQRVRFAILAARAVLPAGVIPEWDAWAARWLDGSDRSARAADAARDAAWEPWAAAETRSATWAAWAAEAWAATGAWVATEAVLAAADAVARAQSANPALDLAALAEQAISEP